MLFGDGAVEHTLNGGPCVPDGLWRFVSISHEVVNEFPGMWARPTCGLNDERNEVDVWIPVEFVLLRSLGHKSWFCAGSRDQGRIARERSNNRHIQIRDWTVKVKDKIHPSVFSLSIDNTGESRYLLFNEYLDATLRLDDVRKASHHSCMPAINTYTIPTAVAVMLFRVPCFVADDTSRTCVRAKLYHICSVGGCRVREHQSSVY